MPTRLTKVVLFLSSYAPLLVILAVRDSFRSAIVGATLVLAAVISVAMLFWHLRHASQLGTDIIEIDNVVSKDSEAMSYIVTYLLPFLDLHFNDWATAASLLILFVTIGLLYVNSSMIHINPMLNLV